MYAALAQLGNARDAREAELAKRSTQTQRDSETERRHRDRDIARKWYKDTYSNRERESQSLLAY